MKSHLNIANLDWIDTAKGIGILSVIAGHVLVGYAANAIYLFHMPLFFFISGFLFKIKPRRYYLESKAKRLLLPYLTYMFIFTTITALIYFYQDRLTPFVLFKMLARDIYGGELLTGWQGVFWFITVLFISQQFLNLIIARYSNSTNNIIVLLMLFTAYLFNYFVSTPLPLDFAVSLYALPIMYIGYLCKTGEIKVNIFIAIVISIAGLVSLKYYPELMRVDMKLSMYGIPVVSFILSISLVIVFLYISSFDSLKKIKILRYCGKESMTIMFLHQFIHLAIIDKFFNSSILVLISTIFLTLLSCYLIEKARSKTKMVARFI